MPDEKSTINSEVSTDNGKQESPQQNNGQQEHAPYPVVGIGASAGGLEALSNFLEHVPADLGMAYVIIQHLAPNHKSILSEILERKTDMKVYQVTNGMHVEKDCVYVIPPNAYMSIIDSKLTLSPRIKNDGTYHSIDHFLMALAEVYKNYAIAVILSGTATDGTAGVQHIKAEGGLTFAQNETAKFQGMPKSAADSGFVDFVMSPEEIAKELAAVKRFPYTFNTDEEKLTREEKDLKKIYQLLHIKKGVDFSFYKQTTINRRIMRRVLLNKLETIEAYVQKLKEDNNELGLLYKDLLINVTSFFRDAPSYQALCDIIFPAIFKDRQPKDPIRIWVPACATGEEVCSMAICLFEFLKEKAFTTPIQIFGTDLNEAAIDKARTGIFDAPSLEHVSEERQQQFFIKLDGKYQIIKAIRDVCVFATQNLLKDPPFSRMDIISCQNVMIYIESMPQKKILQSFHYALKPTGYLMLGKSETVGATADIFDQVNKELKIYTKKESYESPRFDFSLDALVYPKTERLSKRSNGSTNSNNSNPPETQVDIEKETEKLLLARYVLPSIVVNSDMHIIRFQGAISDYLQPATGAATLQLMKMVKDELIFDLRALIQKAKQEGQTVTKENIKIKTGNQSRKVSVEVVPVKPSAKDAYYLILFKEQAVDEQAKVKKGINRTHNHKDVRIIELEKELTSAREQMKAMSEEFEATREELQSANEEVLSSNEELQSINEELETSKEELQSANEELITINEEFQIRNTDLKEAGDYSTAIVETMRECLIVLNSDLRVRTANKAYYSTFKTSSGDIAGNYFFEINNRQWNIEELKNELEALIHKEEGVQTFEVTKVLPHLGERIFQFNAMFMDKDEKKKGRILLAIEDITQRKKNEQALKEREESYRLLIQNAFDIITIFNRDGSVKYRSESFTNILGYTHEEGEKENIYNSSFVHPDDKRIKESLFNQSLENPGKKVTGEFRLKQQNGDYKTFETAFSNLLSNPRVNGIVANYHDITDRTKMEKQKDDFLSIASHELKTPVTSIKAYAEILADRFTEVRDDASLHLINNLDKQVTRLTSLISDLLDITKITEGGMQFRDEDFDINELISEVVEDVQQTSNKHTIIKKLQPAKKVYADKNRISQVIVNLLTNAIKYSYDSTDIIIALVTDEQKVTISVQDVGVGMPPEVLSKVFDRFYRYKDDKGSSYPGLGLGLFIASGIVKKYGGNIWAESEVGKGSTFSFTIAYKK